MQQGSNLLALPATATRHNHASTFQSQCSSPPVTSLCGIVLNVDVAGGVVSTATVTYCKASWAVGERLVV